MGLHLFGAMVFRFAPETLAPSFLMMCKGMLGIFVVIVVVWAFVQLLGKITKPICPHKNRDAQDE